MSGPGAEPPAPTGLDEVAVAAREATSLSGEALDRLIVTLAALTESGGGRETECAALMLLGTKPRVLARLDEHVRRGWPYLPTVAAALGRLATRLGDPSTGPALAAVASMNGDGHVRERAVAAMLDMGYPELMPFLVLRTADWVKQVRDPARAGLALLLAENAGTYLPAALPMALVISDRLRGGFARAQATAALLAAPVYVRARLAGSAQVRTRRFVYDVSRTQGWLGVNDLVATAESDADGWIRASAAEAACREAVWSRRLPILHRLSRSPRAEVRLLALTGLARAGADEEVAHHLTDPAPLIRAVARDAAHRTGLDALERYRSAVGEPVPSTGAIAGLVETGSGADVPLLRRLLTHPTPQVRADAVRALRLLTEVDPEELIPLLRDPAPAVIRETTLALRPFVRRVPTALPRELLADPRVELRRAGYRLLRDRDGHERLRAALILTVDPDPRLAKRGRVDLTGTAPDTTRLTWWHPAAPRLVVTADQQAELLDLTRAAAALLGDDTTRLLTTWLEGTGPAGSAPVDSMA
ncbi:hypothetical protein ACIBF5_06455 [Micromonospora sp. NPDC050417]|uniref:hypothetical protein n=1 Tax=Micromonospora sp. NPDC050417 TaxID=3364280 RepID=UPI0037A44D3C